MHKRRLSLLKKETKSIVLQCRKKLAHLFKLVRFNGDKKTNVFMLNKGKNAIQSTKFRTKRQKL